MKRNAKRKKNLIWNAFTFIKILSSDNWFLFACHSIKHSFLQCRQLLFICYSRNISFFFLFGISSSDTSLNLFKCSMRKIYYCMNERKKQQKVWGLWARRRKSSLRKLFIKFHFFCIAGISNFWNFWELFRQFLRIRIDWIFLINAT